MNARRPARIAAITLLVAMSMLAWACSDSPVAPGSDALGPTPSLLGDIGVDAASTVEVLERAAPLAEDEVVSMPIGADGGLIRLPAAGLWVVFPPGAVQSPTTITVVAPAGSLLGYRFFPEGLTFQQPVAVIQDLLGTDVLSLGGALSGDLVAAYFHGELTPTVEALELLPLSLFGRLGVFAIEHFSGYVIGTS